MNAVSILLFCLKLEMAGTLQNLKRLLNIFQSLTLENAVIFLFLLFQLIKQKSWLIAKSSTIGAYFSYSVKKYERKLKIKELKDQTRDMAKMYCCNVLESNMFFDYWSGMYYRIDPEKLDKIRKSWAGSVKEEHTVEQFLQLLK